jgi:hypothetical protein
MRRAPSENSIGIGTKPGQGQMTEASARPCKQSFRLGTSHLELVLEPAAAADIVGLAVVPVVMRDLLEKKCGSSVVD